MSSTSGRPWYPALPPALAAWAQTTATEVAHRLRDPAILERAIATSPGQSRYPRAVHWNDAGVAQGYAGLAIFAGVLDGLCPGEHWDITGRDYLDRAVRFAESAWPVRNPPLGMFSGLAGLSLAAWSLARNGQRYKRLLTGLDSALLPETRRYCEWLRQQVGGVSVGTFDVISGVSGTGAYLLCRRDDPTVRQVLCAVLRALVELSSEVEGLPRWHTPAHLTADEELLRQNPEGNLNCGLAHGIPGPLAILALAKSADVEVPGMTEAIDRLANWLIRNRLDDEWGVNWPTVVPVHNGASPSSPAASPSRAAWWYGSPGVARALWLAAEALSRKDYADLSVRAMEAVFRRPIPERRIDSPTFCHGVAGLLQITLRFAHDTRLPEFYQAARALGEQLEALYRPDSLLGYYSLEPDENRVDQPGLLDGVPGVAMTLVAASTSIEPSWDRLFLLS
jgi:hypothetical protein